MVVATVNWQFQLAVGLFSRCHPERSRGICSFVNGAGKVQISLGKLGTCSRLAALARNDSKTEMPTARRTLAVATPRDQLSGAPSGGASTVLFQCIPDGQ